MMTRDSKITIVILAVALAISVIVNITLFTREPEVITVVETVEVAPPTNRDLQDGDPFRMVVPNMQHPIVRILRDNPGEIAEKLILPFWQFQSLNDRQGR